MSSSCRLYTGCHLSSKQIIPQTQILQVSNARSFDSTSVHHDASSDGSLSFTFSTLT
jgi:hypothetical protein